MLKDQPIKKFKIGGIQVAVWANRIPNKEGGNDVLHSVTIERRYKDEQGNWRSATSFRTGDLPKLMFALTKAYEHLALEEESHENGGEEK
jgi:hypothetical protein